MANKIILDSPEVKKKKSKFSGWFAAFSFLLLFGILFKIMHWPGSGILILVSSISLIVLLLIRFFSIKDKTAGSYILLLLAVVLVLLLNSYFHFATMFTSF